MSLTGLEVPTRESLPLRRALMSGVSYDECSDSHSPCTSVSPTLPFGVKGIAQVNSFGRVYGQQKSDDDGSWPLHTKTFVFH